MPTIPRIREGGNCYGDVTARDNSMVHLGDKHYHGNTARLRFVPQALFNAYGQPHGVCHPATRIELLDDITQWAQQPNSKSIFWLNGMAGTGKSTISYTIAQRLEQRLHPGPAKLGASFFFKRGEGDRASAALFFPTIVHQLRQKVPGLDMLIEEAANADPDICSKSIGEQFNKLLAEPMQRLETYRGQTRYIVVVDALDECENEDDIGVILQLWSSLSSAAKVGVGLFLTSRPELPIRLGFSKISATAHQGMVLHDIPRPLIEQDILVFLTDEFARLRSEYNLDPTSDTPLSNEWPGTSVLKELADLAVPLFIVAATICRFVQDRDWDPQEQLNIILRSRRLGHRLRVAQAYRPVLQRMVSSTADVAARERLYNEFRLIVGAIVTLAEPLSRASLASLLGQPPATIALRLKSLHSVLSVPRQPDAPIRPLHLSFGEFLTNQDIHDQPFYVDSTATHGVLTTKCLTILSQPTPIGLCENMCHLTFPGQARQDVLLGVIDERFPPAIRYACRYWTYHVHQSETKLYDDGEVHTFLQQYFLHWLEAMSLLGRLADVIEQIQMLQCLVSNSSRGPRSVFGFLVDARRFILANRYIIDLAPLQVYSSAIVFAPRSSTVRQVCGKVPQWIQQTPIVLEVWGAELQKLEGHSGMVNAVAFSPDGSLLASASLDNTVRLWDTKTGQVQQTLEGHSNGVIAVAFSPVGSLLASASADKTVRLWDVKKGQAQQTLEGHSSVVSAVAFSPDGSLLASASWDNTARLWDVKTGQARQILERHNLGVEAVAFSPDGSLLASASSDKTVRLWDAKTGQAQQILERHNKEVIAVAFSPDGSLLASASADKTVRLWDVKKGQAQQTLEGHGHWVEAVAFSPDGSLLASASWDKTVRLWDAKTGQAQQLLEGHSGWVKAVAFSPDGSLLASASADKTVRLWDAKTGQAQQLLERHSGWVKAVMFSSDGSLLASASADKTVRLWDTKTGQVQQTLRGHSDWVKAVAFSPDGSLLASASADKTVRLWDVKKGQARQILEGHSGWVEAVTFSPDGSLLASASSDKTVRLWDAKTGQEAKRFDDYPWINEIKFTTDGQALLTKQGTIRIRAESSYVRPVEPRSSNNPILKDEWIECDGQRVLWLPHEYRSVVSAVYGSTVAIGRASGLISFLQIHYP